MTRTPPASRLALTGVLAAAVSAALLAATVPAAAPAAAEPPAGPATGPATVALPPDGPATARPPVAARPGVTARPGGTARPVRPPRTALVLGRAAAAGYAAAVTLHCTPPGGGHPHAARACAALAAAGGRPDRLTPAATLCTLVHAPVTAEIHGWWRGHRVAWTRTYGNDCELRRATGVLFAF